MRNALLVLALSGASTAHADDAEPPPLTQNEQAAQLHYKEGTALLDAKLYERAIAEFSEAYRLAPLPPLLFNIAQAMRLRGDLDGAYAKYGEYLALVPNGPIADEARSHMARITAIRDDEADRKRRRDAEDKKERDAAEAKAAAERAEVMDAARRRREAKLEEITSKRRYGYVKLVGGGAAFVVAGVFAYWSAGHNDEIKSGELATGEDIKSSAAIGRLDNAMGWLFLGGGVGLAAWGAIDLFVRYPLPDMTISPTHEGVSASARWRF